MLIKSEALVLRKIPYGENSAVVSLFTQSHGILSFLFSGIQGKKGKSALIMPGTFLEVVFYYSEKQNLLRAKEVKAVEPFMTEDFLSNNMALICTELVRNTLPDEMPDENLFLSVKTDFFRLYRNTDRDVWFLQRFILKLCDAAGHSLSGQGKDKYLHTGWSRQFSDDNMHNLIQQLMNFETPVTDRITRRRVAEDLVAYMSEVVFPGKDVRSFKVMLDVLDN